MGMGCGLSFFFVLSNRLWIIFWLRDKAGIVFEKIDSVY